MGRFLKVIGMIGALGACAQSPESIAPTYVSTAQYQVMTCPQLEREMARLNERVAVLSDQQRRKRVGDVVENIFSFHPVASAQTADLRPQLALYKGEQQAVRDVLTDQCAGARSARFGQQVRS